jgi:hypothetical protein
MKSLLGLFAAATLDAASLTQGQMSSVLQARVDTTDLPFARAAIVKLRLVCDALRILLEHEITR